MAANLVTSDGLSHVYCSPSDGVAVVAWPLLLPPDCDRDGPSFVGSQIARFDSAFGPAFSSLPQSRSFAVAAAGVVAVVVVAFAAVVVVVAADA